MKMANGEGQLCHGKKNEEVLMRAAISAQDVEKVMVVGGVSECPYMCLWAEADPSLPWLFPELCQCFHCDS
ncbi:uncharacterized [Tachysurus ichikawai]